MKKICSVILFVIFIFAVTPNNAAAEYITPIDFNCYAKVIEVIDGDSIKVSVWETGEIGLVRIIGIDTQGQDSAFNYLSNKIMGNLVYLTVDSNIKSTVGRWSYLHVSKDGTNMSEEMLSLGFGVVKTGHSRARNYQVLVKAQNDAQTNKVGDWAEKNTMTVSNNIGGSIVSSSYTGDKININTATTGQMTSYFPEMSASLARNIVSYRENNPISSVYELKFVDGFTRTLFDKFAPKIDVSTNIAAATKAEMLMLKSLTENDINNLIDYRDKYGFSSVSVILSDRLVSTAKYEANKPYISLANNYQLDYAIPDLSYNLNTATISQLVEVGFTRTQAEQIVEYRSEYTFKTLMELNAVSTYYSEAMIHALEDNIFVRRNNDYININTASLSQLKDLGLTDREAEEIYYEQGYMTNYNKIPVDISRYDGHITLYTDVNNASVKELLSLNGRMTNNIVQEITEWRSEQPFGSIDEVKDLFDELGESALYNAIRKFIVLR